MAKGRRNIGREILQGLREIKSGRHGRVVNLPSVASVREKTGLSQERFATLLGVSIRTLQDWEQGRRAPSGSLLRLQTGFSFPVTMLSNSLDKFSRHAVDTTAATADDPVIYAMFLGPCLFCGPSRV